MGKGKPHLIERIDALDRQDAAFYRELLDTLIEGVYCLNRDRTISFWNRAAEKITGYRAEEVIGSHCYDDILVHTDEQGNPLCHSLCPAAATIHDGSNREQIVYLRHREGHRVPVLTRIAPIRNPDGSVVGAVEMFSDATATMAARNHLASLAQAALLDPLTGIGNRRYAEMVLHDRLSSFDRYQWPFAVLFADVDNFKSINDTYGHTIGDQVLRMVATTLVNSVRASDVVARWGGEEFVLVLTNLEAKRLMHHAEKTRRLVEQSSVATPSGPLRVTVSVGAVTVPPLAKLDEIMERVDALMYKAKQNGRNRVCLEST